MPTDNYEVTMLALDDYDEKRPGSALFPRWSVELQAESFADAEKKANAEWNSEGLYPIIAIQRDYAPPQYPIIEPN